MLTGISPNNWWTYSKKLPWESDFNHEFSSLLIRRFKNKSRFLTQSTTSWDLLQNENHEVTTMSRPSCRRASAGNKPNAQAEQRKPETERWPQDPLERHEAGLSGNQIRASCTELASRKIKALSRARPDELGCLGEASTDSEKNGSWRTCSREGRMRALTQLAQKGKQRQKWKNQA
jgi:hypothetical protein